MSIQINKQKCVGCGRCVQACPGNLLKLKDNKAEIKHVRDCWGCTSCLKECKCHAIDFFLGADVGGMGSTLSYEEEGDKSIWKVTKADKTTQVIEVNKKESNRY